MKTKEIQEIKDKINALERELSRKEKEYARTHQDSCNHRWFRGICSICGKRGKGSDQMGSWGTW